MFIQRIEDYDKNRNFLLIRNNLPLSIEACQKLKIYLLDEFGLNIVMDEIAVCPHIKANSFYQRVVILYSERGWLPQKHQIGIFFDFAIPDRDKIQRFIEEIDCDFVI